MAETASVFGEMLTFQRLLAQTDDPALRKVMIAGKVEDMLNTVVRQIAFHNFETRVHDARKAGELTNEICADLADVQHDRLALSLNLTRNISTIGAISTSFMCLSTSMPTPLATAW